MRLFSFTFYKKLPALIHDKSYDNSTNEIKIKRAFLIFILWEGFKIIEIYWVFEKETTIVKVKYWWIPRESKSNEWELSKPVDTTFLSFLK